MKPDKLGASNPDRNNSKRTSLVKAKLNGEGGRVSYVMAPTQGKGSTEYVVFNESGMRALNRAQKSLASPPPQRKE